MSTILSSGANLGTSSDPGGAGGGRRARRGAAAGGGRSLSAGAREVEILWEAAQATDALFANKAFRGTTATEYIDA